MRTELHTADGEVLEARWDEPEGAVTGRLVLCHPHPLHGGAMGAPFMVAVTRAMVERGIAVLRFNFRGVGASTGTHGGGGPEVADVAAAVAAAAGRSAALPLAVAGWSFGAVTALRWQAATSSTLPYGGVAPPVRSGVTPVLPAPEELAPARRVLVLGDRDQFVPTEELRAYAEAIGAAFELVKGSDHFFFFREERVAEILFSHLFA